jgi:hypothetical protein
MNNDDIELTWLFAWWLNATTMNRSRRPAEAKASVREGTWPVASKERHMMNKEMTRCIERKS